MMVNFVRTDGEFVGDSVEIDIEKKFENEVRSIFISKIGRSKGRSISSLWNPNNLICPFWVSFRCSSIFPVVLKHFSPPSKKCLLGAPMERGKLGGRTGSEIV